MRERIGHITLINIVLGVGTPVMRERISHITLLNIILCVGIPVMKRDQPSFMLEMDLAVSPDRELLLLLQMLKKLHFFITFVLT